MAKAKEYPKPKKGEKVTCLGCNKGIVIIMGVKTNCYACKGKGSFIAE